MQQGELESEEVVDDVECLFGGDLGRGVGGQSLDLDVVLLGVCPYPVENGLAQGGQRLAQAQRVLDVLGHRARICHGPRAGVSRLSKAMTWPSLRP